MNRIYSFIIKLWEFATITIFPKSELEIELENSDCATFANNLPKEFSDKNDIISLLPYRSKIVNELIHLIKYNANPLASEVGAVILHEAILDELSESLQGKKPILTPIPATKFRMKEHGFNQAELLAKRIIELGGKEFLDYEPELISRVHGKKRQTQMRGRRERLANMKQEFFVNSNAVSGRSVIVIDDITTTGATLIDAKRALKEAGARKVICIALAH